MKASLTRRIARRTSDDGGHYIAARFNGPTEAFNHFAQDGNFNLGGYRLLEDEWARDKRAGRAVMVKIVPQFGGDFSFFTTGSRSSRS